MKKPPSAAKKRAASRERAAARLADWERQEKQFDAQDLAFDASEAESDEEAIALARRAIELDPECVDALMLIAGLTARDDAERIEQIAAAVSAGEASLGKDFEALRGEFWLYTETRPYMRARVALAEELAAVGRLNEAAEHLDAMLALNPNDDQGLRYGLLDHLLALGLLDPAEALLRRYDADGSAMWAWGRVLERVLSDDESAARKALSKARTACRFAEPYLSGATPMPTVLPDDYTRGEESEGILCAVEQRAAWTAHPSAIAWLRSQRQ